MAVSSRRTIIPSSIGESGYGALTPYELGIRQAALEILINRIAPTVFTIDSSDLIEALDAQLQEKIGRLEGPERDEFKRGYDNFFQTLRDYQPHRQ